MFYDVLKELFFQLFLMACFLTLAVALVINILSRTKPFNFDEVLARNNEFDKQRTKNELVLAELHTAEKSARLRLDFEEGCMMQNVHNVPHPVRVNLTHHDANLAQPCPQWTINIEADSNPCIAVN